MTIASLFALALVGQADIGVRIDAFLKPYVQSGLFSGVVLAAKGDQVLFRKAYGLANFELEVANSNDTRFCVASITKIMTVCVAMQSLESRKISGGDTLSKFLPDFPNGEKITIAHLLNHRAGIPHRVTTEGEEALAQTAETMAALAAKQKSIAEPGSVSIYSSAGFSVLARVLEIAEGKPFATLLKERVFSPAGMEHSMDTTPYTMVPRRATSYSVGPGRFWPSPPKDYSFLVGAGSVWSTPDDLFRFLRALWSGKLGSLSKSTFADRPTLYWNGLTNGFRSYIDFDKTTENTLIFCGNTVTGAADRLRAAFPKLMAGESIVEDVPRLPEYRADSDDWKPLEGVYRFEPNGPNLPLKAAAGFVTVGESVLVPVAKDRFFAYRDFGDIRVERDAEGKVARLIWTPMGSPPITMTRL